MRLVKWLFWLSIATAALLYFQVDKIPDPNFYDQSLLQAPEQISVDAKVFTTQAGDQTYQIKPLYQYTLNGIVVSLHDADAMRDFWHHGRWKDFLNIRDLCVMWGNNVANGVYQNIDFHNDSWTCWAQWYDNETSRLFSGREISNNHLLIDDSSLKDALMSARIGDQIQLSGYLAAYRNPSNNFQRGTSTTRDDSGNGACETIYVTDFQLIKSANAGIRLLYSLAKWSIVVCAIIWMVNLFKSPLGRARARRQ